MATRGPSWFDRLTGHLAALPRPVRRAAGRPVGVLAGQPEWPAADIELPSDGSDWLWPVRLWAAEPGEGVGTAPGTELALGVALWHDDPKAALSVSSSSEGGVAIRTFDFEGSFVSLAVGLPEVAAKDLSRSYIIRAELHVATETALPLYARLNLRHGPNTEELPLPLKPEHPEGLAVAEFDLAYADFNERRLSAIWLDLIAERPRMTAIRFSGLVLSRRPRADV